MCEKIAAAAFVGGNMVHTKKKQIVQQFFFGAMIFMLLQFTAVYDIQLNLHVYANINQTIPNTHTSPEPENQQKCPKDTTSLSTHNGTKGNPLAALNRRKDKIYPLPPTKKKTHQLADMNVAIKAHRRFVHKGRHSSSNFFYMHDR